MTNERKQLLFFKAATWILVAALFFLFAAAMDFGGARAAWDGTAAPGFASGTGSKTDPYRIETEAQMGYLFERLGLGETFSGKYIVLDANLDLTGNTWELSGAFSGDFDGGCHSIRTDCTLFRELGEGAQVRSLLCFGGQTLSGPILCKTNRGVIAYCLANANVSITDSTNGGLLCQTNEKNAVVRGVGAVGSVETLFSGEDFSTYTAMVAVNNGSIEQCWAAISASGTKSGKYNEATTDPITAYRYSGGATSGCWYDADVYAKATSPCGKPLTTREMQSESFVFSINEGLPTGLCWTLDGAAANGGYPVLDRCLAASASIVGVDQDRVIFHTGAYSFRLGRTGAAGTIRYTLDGSNPVTSETAVAYQPGMELTAASDTVVRMVVESDGLYSGVRTQTLVQLLGAGTAEDPYLINTKLELACVSEEPAAHYLLCADLTFTDEDYQVTGAAPGGWQPIPAFSGVLDGDFHTIANLRGTKGGLVTSLSSGAEIRNLQLVDHLLCNVNSSQFGAIATSSGGTITCCYVRSGFTAETRPSMAQLGYSNVCGGIVGSGGTVRFCVSEGLIPVPGGDEGSRIACGGIAGRSAKVESSVFHGERRPLLLCAGLPY